MKHRGWALVFEIMAHIGCRFAESSIPTERIDFEKNDSVG